MIRRVLKQDQGNLLVMLVMPEPNGKGGIEPEAVGVVGRACLLEAEEFCEA